MKLLRVLWATLREIFDESAYERFLADHQVQPSRDAFAHFLEERKDHLERKPRCC